MNKTRFLLRVLSAVALVLAGLTALPIGAAQAADPTLSAGCAALADPATAGTYSGHSVTGTFAEGDQIKIVVDALDEEDTPFSLTLTRNTSSGPVVVTSDSNRPGLLIPVYVPLAGDYTVTWANASGPARHFQVGCESSDTTSTCDTFDHTDHVTLGITRGGPLASGNSIDLTVTSDTPGAMAELIIRAGGYATQTVVVDKKAAVPFTVHFDNPVFQMVGTEVIGFSNTTTLDATSTCGPTPPGGSNPLTVSVSGTQTYGGAPSFSPSASLPAGVTLSGTPACTATTAGTIGAATPVGSYIVDPTTCSGLSLAGPQAGAYSLSYAGGGFTVAPALVTVTPAAASAPYGTVPVVTPTYAGFVNGQSASVLTSPATCVPNTTSTTTAGVHPNTSTCSGAAAANYTFSYPQGTVTINKARVKVTTAATSTFLSLFFGGSYVFSTKVVNADTAVPVPVVGVPVTVAVTGTTRSCTSTTDSQGVATCGISPALFGMKPFTATVPATTNYLAGSGSGQVPGY